MGNYSRYLLPLTRLSPIYPGQLGVDGSDVPRGVQTVPGRKVFYVDHDHADASDAHDGVDPEHPKLTIQAAVDSPWLATGDVIMVGPASQGSTYTLISAPNYHENVVVDHGHPAFITLMAAGASKFQVVWDKLGAAATTVPLLDLRCPGWVVSGFKFHAPALGPAIMLRDEGMGDLDNTQYTLIEDNYFDGAWAGKYGIEMQGAAGNTVIRGNWFLEHHQAGGDACAIISTVNPNADPFECVLEGNIFQENDNHVDVTYGASLIRGNVFYLGDLLVATMKLDLRLGTQGHNIVTGNIFQGTYSIAGGYAGNIAHPDFWMGNFASPGAGVGADSGHTILPPA
jgi:hypothetical protein